MNTTTAETVYLTLTDLLPDQHRVPGVENAFSDGALCAKLYQEIYQANLRLCARLGQPEEDPDVELIINNFLEISEYLCAKMYHYGKIPPAPPGGMAVQITEKKEV